MKNKMIRILIFLIVGIILFIIGIRLSVFLEPFLRGTMIFLYQWTTNENIQFVGKNFILFVSPIYYLSIGLTLILLTLDFWKKSTKQLIKYATIWALIFVTSLIGICALDANIKIIECTACNDGIRKLRYNDINYGLMLSISIILSGIPSIVRLIKYQLKRNK